MASGARPSGPGPEVICLGETMALATPNDGAGLASCETLRLAAAGAESTVAQYLANLGHRCAWVSRLGDDPFGRRIRAGVAAQGVDVSWVRTDPDAPTAVFFKDPSPTGSPVYYYRRGSAASRMCPEDLADLPLDGTRVLHLSGITPGLSAECAALVDVLLDQAPRLGVRVSFDVNYRPGLWSVDHAAPVLRALAERADLTLVGRDEAHALWGTETAVAVRKLLGPRGTLVVKDGPVGATGFDGDDEVFVPAPVVEVVEPVGAGDAFAAGYLSGLLRGLGPADRLRLGHRLAARSLGSLDDFVPISASERVELIG